jgi:hypothetical protein
MLLAATLGAKALYLFILWLASAYAAGYLSERKGYGDKPGLASGLVLTFVGAIIWLLIPARPDSLWREKGAFGSRISADDE